MKIMSDNAVTKQDLVSVDEKQTQQIKKLRIYLALSFLVNAFLTIGLHFWR